MRPRDLARHAADQRAVACDVYPLAAVMLAEFGNEAMEYLTYGMRWADTLSDIVNTLFGPLVISLAVRLRPMALRDYPHH